MNAMRKLPDKSACVDHGCKGFGLGYATAWITVDGVRMCTTKHRKVYYEATGELPEVVRHTCDNPRCINLAHLVAGTQKDNMQDCKERGRLANKVFFGESNGNVKLTDAQVTYIRNAYVKGSKEFGCVALARMFNVGTSQIWRVVKGLQR